MSAAMIGICMPSFLLGPLLVLIFGIHLEWVPVSGWGDAPGDKILPAITLGTGYAAYIARLARRDKGPGGTCATASPAAPAASSAARSSRTPAAAADRAISILGLSAVLHANEPESDLARVPHGHRQRWMGAKEATRNQPASCALSRSRDCRPRPRASRIPGGWNAHTATGACSRSGECARSNLRARPPPWLRSSAEG